MKPKVGFLSLLKTYKTRILNAFICIISANLLGLAFPWVIKIIIDDVLIRKDTFLLNQITFGLILVFILKFYFGFMREYLVSVIGEKVVYDLRGKLYAHLQKLSVRYIENKSTGEIISGIIGDVESIKNFLFGGVLDFICSFFNVLFVLVILLVLDWKLTLICLIFLPVFGITFFKLTPRLKEKHRIEREKYGQLTARLNEVFQGIRIVTGFQRQSYETDRFDVNQKEIFKTSLKSHKLGILLWIGAEFVSALGLVCLIWFGARAVFSGRITAGTLIAFYSYLGMLFYPIVKLVIVNNYYQEAAASLERINRVLAEQPTIEEIAHPIKLDKLDGNIRFAGVSFSYDKIKEVFSEINFEVANSEVIALVGKSGVGKTTLISLLLRFYDPTKGAIFVDRYNLKDLELKSYRGRIAMVLQDDYLFRGTIRENILYSKPDAHDSEIIRVAELAKAHQFIMELPDRYDSQIGERGIKLSYGQRQRISIARAILRNPDILILDEATSSVDSETERLIIEQAYKNLIQGRTTFIIAHRLSTITYASKILFIQNGRITESGDHFQLLDKKGSYWRMWLEQTVSADLSSEAQSVRQSS